MPNAYVSLDTLKGSGVLDITGTGEDTRLRLLVEAMSRSIDRYCGRHFYALSATRTFNGDGGLYLLIPDLIAIDTSGLKTDDNKDRTFETTWATTDYMLLPNNADPTTRENAESRPYMKIWVDVDAGTEDVWTQGRQTVQIAGQWGFWRHLKRATETANAIADATTTSVVVSARTHVETGHTILIDSEQIYVESYSSNTLTVRRGVNGTTAAAHSASAVIDIYEYPPAVREAVIIEASKLYKRRSTGFTSVMGMETGEVQVFKDMAPETYLLLAPFKKLRAG